jgi:hypothetical protein
MSYIIRAIAFANGAPCPHAGEWLQAFDHDAHGEQGHGVFTDDISKARRFATQGEALAFWHQQSTVKPIRPDGRPNKPLTALTALFEQIVE